MRPVEAKYRVSQHFGSGATQGIAPNSDPDSGWPYYVYLYGNYQPLGHAGLDIACPVGTPIYAPADGTVIYAGWSEDLPGTGPIRKWLFYYNFGGILTLIQHKGWISVIAHQSNNNHVKVGQKVKEGQLIGLSGNTKTRTTKVAPHVHIEAIVDLSYRSTGGLIYGRTDPEPFFGSAAIAPQGTTTTPKGFLMALTDEKQERLFFLVERYLDMPISTVPKKTAAAVWLETVFRGGKNVSVKQELADAKTEAQALRAVVGALAKNPDLSADQITAAVKAGLAEGVVTVDVNVNGGSK